MPIASNYKKGERKLWICLPGKEDKGEYGIQHNKNGHTYKIKRNRVSQGHHWEWHRMPDGVYQSKQYPTCDNCGFKYVKKCYHCQHNGGRQTNSND